METTDKLLYNRRELLGHLLEQFQRIVGTEHGSKKARLLAMNELAEMETLAVDLAVSPITRTYNGATFHVEWVGGNDFYYYISD